MAKETSAFVRKLAHNSPAVRRAAFKALAQYVQSPAGQRLRSRDLEKLCKGLYFSMWYCDKPVPQQTLAGAVGELFSQAVPQNRLADMHRAFWAVMMREWHAIDKWRLDKFLMLVRRVLRHCFFRLAAHAWPPADVAAFLAVLQEYPLSNNARFPQALAYHVADIYLDEIEYVIFKDFRDYSEEDDGGAGSDDDSDADSGDDDDGDDGGDGGEHTDNTEEDDGTEKKGAAPADTPLADAAKARIVAQTPLAALVAPFEALAAGAKNKAMRAKAKEEVLGDERLARWTGAQDDSSGSEDEWTGF